MYVHTTCIYNTHGITRTNTHTCTCMYTHSPNMSTNIQCVRTYTVQTVQLNQQTHSHKHTR